MKISDASSLSNAALTDALARFACGEREATAALIVHLAEFDARRLYEGAGFSSMFKYCQVVLRLSEDAAYNRIESARAARRYPEIVDRLVAGTLSPTTARLLARRLTAENHDALLAAASGKSKQEVEELLARWFPQPEVAPSVRRVPAPQAIDLLPDAAPSVASPGMLLAAAPVVAAADGSPGPSAEAGSPPPCPSVTPRALVRPLSPERYALRFTVSAETREKLRLAQDLLGHAVPSGDLAEVFDRALTILIDDLKRKKFAATRRPRRSQGQAEGSRNIPAEVRRKVVARDAGRCAFVATEGRRCGERRFIEFHHVVPRGTPTVENIQLRCRTHNGHEVDLYYGPGRRVTRETLAGEAGSVLQLATGRRTRSRTSTRSESSRVAIDGAIAEDPIQWTSGRGGGVVDDRRWPPD